MLRSNQRAQISIRTMALTCEAYLLSFDGQTYCLLVIYRLWSFLKAAACLFLETPVDHCRLLPSDSLHVKVWTMRHMRDAQINPCLHVRAILAFILLIQPHSIRLTCENSSGYLALAVPVAKKLVDTVALVLPLVPLGNVLWCQIYQIHVNL